MFTLEVMPNKSGRFCLNILGCKVLLDDVGKVNVLGHRVISSLKHEKKQEKLASLPPGWKNLLIYSWDSLANLERDQKCFISILS